MRHLALLIALLFPGLAGATTGPGCLRVVNVSAGDALNLRAGPSASAEVLALLVPEQHGIIHLDAACQPASIAPGSRWCPVTYYEGDSVRKGWVKARFTAPSDCP